MARWRRRNLEQRTNRPFARSGHMVQNHTCWWASCAAGLLKQCNSYQSTWNCLRFWSPNAQLAHQHVCFYTMWPDRAKGLLLRIEKVDFFKKIFTRMLISEASQQSSRLLRCKLQEKLLCVTWPLKTAWKDHKRFCRTAAVLDPQLGFTYSADVVCTIFFPRATYTSSHSFQFFSIGHTAQCLSIFNPTFFRALWVPAKSKQYFRWLTFDRQTVMDVSRLHINEGARRNKQCAGCRRFHSLSLCAFRARPIFPSPFPFLVPATQAKVKAKPIVTRSRVFLRH